MTRTQRRFLVVSLFSITVLISGWVCASLIHVKRLDRVARFNNVYFHVVGYESSSGDPPASLTEAVPDYLHDELLGHPGGWLEYKIKPDGRWQLNEVGWGFIGSFGKDQLIAESRKPPYWKDSGNPASR